MDFCNQKDGTFKAELVAFGYSQIPGIELQESYSPVMNDVTLCIMILTQLVWKLKPIVLDVEVAFLIGDLEEEIYVEVLMGIPQEQEDEKEEEKTCGSCAMIFPRFFMT